MADQVVATAANEGSIPKVQNIFDVSSEFLGQFKTWLEQNPPAIPITQIIGFTGFTVTDSNFPSRGGETTTSTTYTDLLTVGPTISGLADGQYVIVFGCQPHNVVAGDGGAMSIDVNGAGASDDDLLSYNPLSNSAYPAGTMSCTRVVAKRLSNGGNNTITAKYRSVLGNTATFGRRWMIALKFSN